MLYYRTIYQIFVQQYFIYSMNILGLYFVKKFLNTTIMRIHGASLNRRSFPGCEKHVFDTRKYWNCYIKHLPLTSYHPAFNYEIIVKNKRVYIIIIIPSYT